MPASPPHATQLCALLSAVPDNPRELARLCEAVEDWTALFRLAADHAVAGVLLAEIVASGYALSAEIVRGERRIRMCEALFHDVLVRGLADALRVLAERGIEVVPLKGPILAERYYPVPEHRPSTDLDLLVRVEDLERAVTALTTLGYLLEGGSSGDYFRTHHHHVHLVHRTLPVVELHYHAYRGFGVTLLSGPLLDRAVPHSTARWSVSTLSPEDELLYLATHGASHRFERLGWLYDIKLLVRAHPDLDWSLIAARAEALGLGAILSLTCDLLARDFGVPRSWGDAIAPLGTLRTRATTLLLPSRENHAANAAARFGFNTAFCYTPAIAAKSVARFLAIKIFNEIPRRIARTLFDHT